MRHRKSRKHFNRSSSHRRAMFRNMSVSLLTHESIKTTLAKAKELRRVVEPLITLARTDSVANRRLAFSRLRDKLAVSKLFEEIAPRFTNRPGGYTRVLKCGFRTGDAAPLGLIQLVELSPDFGARPKAEQVMPVPLVDEAAQDANIIEGEVVEERATAESAETSEKQEALTAEAAPAEEGAATEASTEEAAAQKADDSDSKS